MHEDRYTKHTNRAQTGGLVGANSKERNVCKVITFKTGWTLVWRGQPYTSKIISKDTEAKVPVIHFIGLV